MGKSSCRVSNQANSITNRQVNKRTRSDEIPSSSNGSELDLVLADFEQLADRVDYMTGQFKNFVLTQSKVVIQQQETNNLLVKEINSLKSSLESLHQSINKLVTHQSNSFTVFPAIVPSKVTSLPTVQPIEKSVSSSNVPNAGRSNILNSQIISSNSNAKSSWSTVAYKKRSFRDVVMSHPVEKQAAVSKLLKLSNRFLSFNEPSKPKTDAEKDSKVRLVYVRGISRMKLSELRKSLKEVDIFMKPILSIRFIGRSVTEFMILEDFEKQFKRKISAFGDFITIIDHFDPRSAKNTEDHELMKHACNRFVESCSRIIDSEKTSP